MARRIPADKIKNKKSPKGYHDEHCPCKGKPQEPSDKLLARQAAYDGIKLDPSMGFRRPGSQNRKKR